MDRPYFDHLSAEMRSLNERFSEHNAIQARQTALLESQTKALTELTLEFKPVKARVDRIWAVAWFIAKTLGLVAILGGVAEAVGLIIR